MNPIEQQIRERAYFIWEGEGRVFGRAEDHWLRAERDLHGRGSHELGLHQDAGPMIVQAVAQPLAPSPAETLKTKATRTRAAAKTEPKPAATRAPTKATAKATAATPAKPASAKSTSAKPASAKSASVKPASTKPAARAKAPRASADSSASIH